MIAEAFDYVAFVWVSPVLFYGFTLLAFPRVWRDLRGGEISEWRLGGIVILVMGVLVGWYIGRPLYPS